MANEGELRKTIATACRILAYQKLVREITGHVSARIDGSRMLIRCRGQQEAGLAFTQEEAVRAVNFDGSDLDKSDEFETPIELPIHGEIYRVRPEVGAVVHAHPRASMICSIAGFELKPIYGAFDPYSMALGTAGIPVFPRSALIREAAMARSMIEAMGGKSVCLLRGHGIVTIGATVEEATLRAIQLETLASITLELAKAGIVPSPISQEDRDSFHGFVAAQDKKSKEFAKSASTWTWRHYVKILQTHEAKGEF